MVFCYTPCHDLANCLVGDFVGNDDVMLFPTAVVDDGGVDGLIIFGTSFLSPPEEESELLYEISGILEGITF